MQTQNIDEAHERALSFNGDRFAEILRSENDPKFAADVALALNVAERVRSNGGRVLAVGGFVRDLVLRRLGKGTVSKDVDLEVYGMTLPDLKGLLAQVAEDPKAKELARGSLKLDEVGESFGVIKFGGLDVALTRRDSRTEPGMGRKAQPEADPTMTYPEAAFRRDLTINALAMDPLTGEILDTYGGLDDLKNGVLRHVYTGSPEETQFADDPLRVLRVMQFAGRFGFSIAPETMEFCRAIPLSFKLNKKDERPGALAGERIGEEWGKLLLKAKHPSVGLKSARDLGVIQKMHPELQLILDASSEAQDRHESITPWDETLSVVDAMSAEVRSKSVPEGHGKVLMLAALCRRMSGDAQVASFLNAMYVPKNEVAGVRRLVETEKGMMKAVETEDGAERDEAIRRLAFDLGRGKTGLTVRDAVAILRSKSEREKAEQLYERAVELHVAEAPPQVVVSGDDLKTLGVVPGPGMKTVLDRVMDEQLKGVFDSVDHIPSHEKAIEFAKRIVDENNQKTRA